MRKLLFLGLLQLYDLWGLFQSSLSECGCVVAAWRSFLAVEWDMCSGSAIPMTFLRATRWLTSSRCWEFLVAARPPPCWAYLNKSEFFVVLLLGNGEQLVAEHLFSREGWVAVFCEQNLFSAVCISVSYSFSVSGGWGAGLPERHPGHSQMLPCDMCVGISSAWTSLLSLSCTFSNISPEDNFYCRTDGKRKEIRQSAWQWKWSSTAAGPLRDGDISFTEGFKISKVKTLNSMT